MSRAALAGAAGPRLPLLPATLAGGLPAPPDLELARVRFARGSLAQRDLDELTGEAIQWWLARQERAGVDVLVDGQLYAGADLFGWFAEALDGMELAGLVRAHDNCFRQKPVIRGPVRWEQPVVAGWWRFAQGHAARPVKAVIAGPYTLMHRSCDGHYGDRRAACLALAAALRHEVGALVGAGARIVQIDEPALGARPAEVAWTGEALAALTDGLDAYWILRLGHGPFDAVIPHVAAWPVDNLDVAFVDRSAGPPAWARGVPVRTDLSAGVVEACAPGADAVATVTARIGRALGIVPAEALWVTTDGDLVPCGVQGAADRIGSLVEGTRQVRERLAAGAGAAAPPA